MRLEVWLLFVRRLSIVSGVLVDGGVHCCRYIESSSCLTADPMHRMFSEEFWDPIGDPLPPACSA